MANDFSSVISLQLKGLNKLDTLEQRLAKIQNYKIKIDLDTSSTKVLAQLKSQLESMQKTAARIYQYTGGASARKISSNNTTSSNTRSYSNNSSLNAAEKEALNVKKAWQNAYKNLNKMDKSDAGYQTQSDYVKKLKSDYLQLNAALGKTSAAYKSKNSEMTQSLRLQLQEINNNKTIKALNKAQSTLSGNEKEVINAYKKYSSEYLKLAKMDSSDGGYKTQAEYVDKLKLSYDNLKGGLTQTSRAYEEQSKTLEYNLKLRKEEIEQAKRVADANYSPTKANNSLYNMAYFAATNTKAYNKYASQFQSIASMFGKSEKGDTEAQNQWAGLMSMMQSEGLVQPSFLNQMATGFSNIGKSLLSMVNPTTILMKYFPQMISTVKGIDAAMTELYKVTDNSKQQYSEFSKEVKSISQEIGTTQTEMINSTADFARLGYSLTESTSLAKQANLYKNVGDMDISHATEYMISTLKAFNLQASEASHVVDAYNEVGNNYAISSEGLGEAMERSGAALSAANNTFEESIGLITAANVALQNPESTGTMLKTIAMRIRGASTELEDAGLSTEGMATSTSKLRDELMALSGVDILESGGNAFKSTYDIMKELSEVWDNLSDLTQANITELIAGKRGGTIMASLMSNFDDATNATKSAINSAGSAIRENESVLDSIDGRLTKLKSTFESLSSDIVSSKLIKTVVSGGTTILSIVEKIFGTLGSGLSTGIIVALGAFISKLAKLSIAAKTQNLLQLFTTGTKGTATGLSLLSKSLSDVKGKFTNAFSSLKTDGVNAALDTLTQKTNSSGEAVSTLGSKFAKFGLVAGVTIGAIYAAYKIWDANTTQLGEVQQSLTENLNQYTDAQSEIESLTDKIKSNNEEIAELEASSSLSNAAQVASLKQSNAELKQQIAYQEQLANISKNNATVNAISALNYGEGAYYIGAFSDNLYSTSDSFLGKLMAFFHPGISSGQAVDDAMDASNLAAYYKDNGMEVPALYSSEFFDDAEKYGSGEFLTEKQALNRSVKEYNEAKERYEQAMKDGDQNAVSSASKDMAKWSDLYTEIIDNYYNYLDAFSDDNGNALEGYEEQYADVRATITKFAYDTGATKEETLKTILDYYENDGLGTKLAKLQKQSKLTSTYLERNFSDLVGDLEDVGMSAQDVVDIFEDLYDADGFASALIYNNLSEVQSAVSSLVSLRSTLTSAMAMSGSAGGLDFENYYNLITNGFGSAVQYTKNGIKTNYSAYQKTLTQTYNKKIGENVSDLKDQAELYDDVLKELEKSKLEWTSAVIASDDDAADAALKNISTQQSYINTIKNNIKYLEAERSVYDGLNSNVTKYIDSMTDGMAASTVSDTISDSISDLEESVQKGKVSTPQAREFANLFNFEDLDGIKNSEVEEKYKEAIAKISKLYDTEQDEQDEDKVNYIYSASKVIAALQEFEKASNTKFLNDKDIEITTSGIMNLAKYLDISESEATELIYALNDFGYNVNIEDTTQQVDDLRESLYNTSTLFTSGNRISDFISAVNEARANGETSSDGIDSAVNNLIGQSNTFLYQGYGTLETRKEKLNEYIQQVQQARELANQIGNGDAEEKLAAILSQALKVQQELNRATETVALMKVNVDAVVDGDATGLTKLQELQTAIENYETAKSLKFTYGIDVDTESAEGEVERAYDELAQYIQNNYESLELDGLNLDIDEYSTVEEIESAIRSAVENGTINLGQLAAAFNIQLNDSDVSNATAEIYEKIREAYVNAKEQADKQFGAGNYTLQFDMQGNVTGISIDSNANIPEVDVKVNTEKVKEADKKIEGTAYKLNNLRQNAKVDSTVKVTTSGVSGLQQINNYLNSVKGVHSSTLNYTTNSYNNTYNNTYNVTKYLTSKGKAGRANGTAHASGDWGTKKSETALVGELGEELVVYGDKWYTVGSSGAEFTHIPAGAIVFNHKQTEELFKNGYVTTGGGRGRAHVNGTAYASGSASDDPLIDYVKSYIDRVEYELDYNEARKSLYGERGNLNWLAPQRANYYNQLYKAYWTQGLQFENLAKGSLSNKVYNKVKNGTLTMELVNDENLRKQVERAQTYLASAREAYVKSAEYLKKIRTLRSEMVETITDDGENTMSMYSAQADRYKAEAEALRDVFGTAEASFDNIYSAYNNQFDALSAEFDTAVKTRDKLLEYLGTPTLEEWRQGYANYYGGGTEFGEDDGLADYYQQVAELEEKIAELGVSMREVNDAIRELNWANFNSVQESLDSLQTQLDSVVDLIDDFDSFGSDGKITKYGLTQLGLLASSLASTRQEIANYNVALETLDSDYKQNLINIDEYTESVNEYQEAQLSAVVSAKKYKNAIIDLIKEGINAETDAYKDLIDARKEDLDKQKESNDYAKSIAEKTTEINKIQAQIAALSGDDSQASRAKLRSLEADLKEAQDDLEETRQDHYYDELSNGYDEEYERFEEAQQARIDALSESLDTQTKSIASALATVSDEYESVYSTLSEFAKEYGIAFTDSVVRPWDTAKSAVEEYYAAINAGYANVTIQTGNYNYIERDAISGAISSHYANGAYNARGGLTLTDEQGVGSELLLTKNGVIRQLEAGDTVFNASQRSMLWQISQMPLPTILDNMQSAVSSAVLAGGNSTANVNVNYDSLITVNGNVDENVLPNLEEICKQASEYTKRDMLTTFKKLGVG